MLFDQYNGGDIEITKAIMPSGWVIYSVTDKWGELVFEGTISDMETEFPDAYNDIMNPEMGEWTDTKKARVYYFQYTTNAKVLVENGWPR